MQSSALALLLALGGSTGTGTGSTGGASESTGSGASDDTTDDTGGTATEGTNGTTGTGSTDEGTSGSTTGTTTGTSGSASATSATSSADELGSDTFYDTDPTYGDFTPEDGCADPDDEDVGCCDSEENNSDNFCSVSRVARDRIAIAVALLMLARPRRPRRRTGGRP